MIKKVKKYSIIALTMFMFLAFNSSGVLADDDRVLNLGARVINDVNKNWTVTFNYDVDFSSIPGNLQIKDITTNNVVAVNIVQGERSNIVKINAPSGGYTVGHNYQISLGKNIKLTTGSTLIRTNVLNFTVAAKDSNYTISANVIVSPVINVFKQITVTSTNLSGAVKYKVEGNNNLYDIGKPMAAMLPGNTVKVSIYDSAGNMIGTANMDISTTKNNMTLNLQ